jgi:predicted secreted protein
MIEIRKKQISSDHQCLFHVDHEDDEMRNFQTIIQDLQLFQNSAIISHLLLSHETEDDVEINMQFRLIANYQ